MDIPSEALRLRAFKCGLADRKIGLMHEGLDSVCDLAENLPEDWPDPSPLGHRDTEILPRELASPIKEAKSLVLSRGEPQSINVELRGPPRRVYRVHLTPDRDDEGRVAGLFTVLTDITETQERERAIASLLREVSHRSRNLLAIVQAVAMQTATHSAQGEFLDKFRGRLQALASAQDLVTENDWRGTLFQSLVTAQLARVGQTSMQSIRITGDNPMLRPNAALHVGLALHELGTNALLYGAFSAARAGSVWITASVSRVPGLQRTLEIAWIETTVAAQSEKPHGSHFGTAVLERIVPLSVGGSAYYEVGKDKITYRLTMPANQFEA